MSEKTLHTVVKQDWEESEQDWGTRPDGYSLHLSEAHRENYIKEYWGKMPNSVPECYSRPYSSPKLIDIDEETYTQLVANNGNLRY